MKILLGTLKERGNDLASFLEPRIGAKPEVDGAELTIDDGSLNEGLRSRHVKTYVKRFLRKEKVRRDYRVLVEKGELRLIEIQGTKEEEEERAKAEEEDEKKRKSKEEGSQKEEEEEETPPSAADERTTEK